MTTVTVNLDSGIDEEIKRIAANNGITLEEYVRTTMINAATFAAPEADTTIRPGTGVEILQMLRDHGALYRANMSEPSEDYSRRLREMSQRRRLK